MDSDPRLEQLFGGVPLYARIALDLRAMITQGLLTVGAALPSYASLAKRYHCSLATAQKAVSVLQVEGYVASASGRGTFVVSAHPENDDLARPLRELHAHLDALDLYAHKAQSLLDTCFSRYIRKNTA
ncbi:GntR family transcriptional regulator [Amycolatopsis minnesotensis]|uniref:HTH gntR-type domain-containing protein n=1 Tax=Amycolatopsis minnesotensis TaxID=337894 RepID=A0ABN2SF93_9PSEU